ncbi:zinc finger protein 704-like [Bacillus rossius redtenbacheri]|uniref:zinc finger protein 704-like n=1 Tax=Bacillus rossius redtenbacheri TaxID=93214 RepID=UPI002FDDE676
MVFQCTWPGCGVVTNNCVTIEAHVRKVHLGPRKNVDDSELSDHEEEFYYMEVEQGPLTSSPPTLSHRDMARPPHEDPEYQKQIKSIFHESPVNTPLGGVSWGSSTTSPSSPQKHLKLSSRHHLQQGGASLLSLSAPSKSPGSPTRRSRGDTKKCRKVYGMDHRDNWCTQCKWKKACSRFND